MKKILLALILAASSASVVTPVVAAASAVETPVAENAMVKLHAGAIELIASGDEAVHFQVYSITGQMVKSVDVAAGMSVMLDVPSGYYIVKCPMWSKRVVVK